MTKDTFAKLRNINKINTFITEAINRVAIISKENPTTETAELEELLAMSLLKLSEIQTKLPEQTDTPIIKSFKDVFEVIPSFSKLHIISEFHFKNMEMDINVIKKLHKLRIDKEELSYIEKNLDKTSSYIVTNILSGRKFIIIKFPSRKIVEEYLPEINIAVEVLTGEIYKELSFVYSRTRNATNSRKVKLYKLPEDLKK